jgi:Ca-activated chloride channel homolog
MADPIDARTGSRLRPRAAIFALLFAATLALGAAARFTHPRPATPPRIAIGGSAVALTANLDRSSVLRGTDGLVRVELVLRGRAAETAQPARVPTDLVVVLDRSGSMDGAPIATALAAVRELIAGLGDGDRFALVSYASDVAVDIPLETASAAARERWDRRVAEVVAGGGTNLSSGLDAGHRLLAETARAGRAGRMIVLSDGLANEGDASLDGLSARARRARPAEYVLSAVGIGGGFSETVMSALADAGTGNFYYLPDVEKLAGIFADEFAAAREMVARAVAVRIAPAPGVRIASAGGYPLLGEPGAVSFSPGDLFAGQERRIWLTLYAPTDALGDVALGALSVEFATPGGERQRIAPAELPKLACVANDADYFASFDAERYKRAELGESIGELKQRVARKVSEGRQSEAIAELDAYQAQMEQSQLRALGYAIPEAVNAVKDLRSQASSPAAAAPDTRSGLGKKLFESGRDDQRAGAKR